MANDTERNKVTLSSLRTTILAVSLQITSGTVAQHCYNGNVIFDGKMRNFIPCNIETLKQNVPTFCQGCQQEERLSRIWLKKSPAVRLGKWVKYNFVTFSRTKAENRRPGRISTFLDAELHKNRVRK